MDNVNEFDVFLNPHFDNEQMWQLQLPCMRREIKMSGLVSRDELSSC